MTDSYWAIKWYKTVLIKNDPGSKQPGFFSWKILSEDDKKNLRKGDLIYPWYKTPPTDFLRNNSEDDILTEHNSPD